MEARAKQNAAAAAAATTSSSTTSDKSKPEPETRKPEASHVTDAVLHANNNAAHARNANDYGGHRAETGNVGCKMAVVGSSTGDLYARRPTSVIAFSVPPSKMVDEQRACVNDRKSNLAPFGVMSLT